MILTDLMKNYLIFLSKFFTWVPYRIILKNVWVWIVFLGPNDDVFVLIFADSNDDSIRNMHIYILYDYKVNPFKVPGINLETPCFSHGQLYVACSRVWAEKNLYVFSPDCKTRIIVYQTALQ